MSSASIGFEDKASARCSIIAVVALGAAVALVGPVSAQSPNPSTEPAVAASTATVPAPGGLEALEAGFATQACDPIVSAETLAANAGVAVTGISGGLRQSNKSTGAFSINCTFSVDGGDVSLVLSRSSSDRKGKGKGKPKTADLQPAITLRAGVFPDLTKLDGLGDVAFTFPRKDDFFSYLYGRAGVTWAQWMKHGKAFADHTAELSSDVLDVDALKDIAAIVPLDATPGDLPSAIAPSDDAAPLLGSWTLSGWTDGFFTYDGPATMTATFDADGTVTRTFDCKRNKGAKPVPIADLYFLDGDRIMTVTGGGGSAGQECRWPDGDPTAFLMFLSAFDPIGASSQAIWAVEGDTLRIDDRGTGLTLARASD